MLKRFFAPSRRLAQTWIALGILAPLGMLLVSGLMLSELRQDAWDKAGQTSNNLLQVIERDIARNVELIDLSLRGVVDNLKAPGVRETSPELRQLILFDRAATAEDIGVMLVLDENGDSVHDASSVPARPLNNADRDYFQAHKARPNLGLYISAPLISRLTAAPIIVLSRRIDKPDGSFGGVALASLRLAYFRQLFDRIGLGREGAINLYRGDGTRLMRYPYAAGDIGVSIAGSDNFERFVREGSGTFVADSVRDGVERQYTFTKVRNLPLVLNVALATADIEAGWRNKAAVIGSIVLVLCALTIGLSLAVGRELRSRALMQAELVRLSRTDALTGLLNRRRFDEALSEAWDAAYRGAHPLSLLIVDADHFKRYNDRYGHAVGDKVLAALAACLSDHVPQASGSAYRIGGEEFAILLPWGTRDDASRVAEAVREGVARIGLEMVGLTPGSITVSVGTACLVPNTAGIVAMSQLYRLADAALYEAKAAGRNRIHAAVAPPAMPATGQGRSGQEPRPSDAGLAGPNPAGKRAA